MCFIVLPSLTRILLTALNCLPAQDHDPDHVGKKREAWRPADIHARSVSARSHGKKKDHRIKHKTQKPQKWKSGGQEQCAARFWPDSPLADRARKDPDRV